MMTCRICASSTEHPSYPVREMMLGIRDEHLYFQCKDCGCLQIHQIPEQLAEYYPANYYSYVPPKTGSQLKQHFIQTRDRYAVTGQNLMGRVLNLLMPNAKLATLRSLHLTPESRILDVGCGAGLMLHALCDIGFKNVLGIDPFNNDTIHYPNGLVIEKRDIFSESGEWDLIMFNHSFEHLVEQQKTLLKAHSLLVPKGRVMLRIPTVSSYAWQHYGVNWAQLDAPRHLFLHSVDSMNKLAQQTGFQVTDVRYDSNAFQFWGSEQYEQDIPLRAERSWAENPDKSIFKPEQIRQFEKRAHELNALNQGDQAAFYLKKAT